MTNSHIKVEKLNGLDHLRALAIILVFFFHYSIISEGKPIWLQEVSSFGWTGVDLFFVLSGFLISSQLFEKIKKNEKIIFEDFFIKRFFRILPAYFFTLGLYFCFQSFREKESLPLIWRFLTFTQNFELNIKDFGTFSHAWSLCVEEHFYLILPFILIFLVKIKYFKKSYLLISLLIIFGLIIRLYSYNNLYFSKINEDNNWLFWYKFIYYPTYNRLDGLLIGISLAGLTVFYSNLFKKISKYGNQFILIGFSFLVFSYFLCIDQQSFYASIFGFLIIAIGFGFLVLGAISSTSFLFKFQSKILSLIATLSYAIYLIHKGIIHLTQELLKDFMLNENLMILCCLITTLIGAYILNIIIEKPFMKLRDKLLNNRNRLLSNTFYFVLFTLLF